MDELKSKKDLIIYKHLLINKSDGSAFLLGYKLKLTKTEFLILNALAEAEGSTVSAEQISLISSLELSKQNLAFHVFNINSKAKLISGRNLIKNISKNGYFLNDMM